MKIDNEKSNLESVSLTSSDKAEACDADSVNQLQEISACVKALWQANEARPWGSEHASLIPTIARGERAIIESNQGHNAVIRIEFNPDGSVTVEDPERGVVTVGREQNAHELDIHSGFADQIEEMRQCAQFLKEVANRIPSGNLYNMGGLEGLSRSYLVCQAAEGYYSASQPEPNGNEFPWPNYSNLTEWEFDKARLGYLTGLEEEVVEELFGREVGFKTRTGEEIWRHNGKFYCRPISATHIQEDLPDGNLGGYPFMPLIDLEKEFPDDMKNEVREVYDHFCELYEKGINCTKWSIDWNYKVGEAAIKIDFQTREGVKLTATRSSYFPYEWTIRPTSAIEESEYGDGMIATIIALACDGGDQKRECAILSSDDYGTVMRFGPGGAVSVGTPHDDMIIVDRDKNPYEVAELSNGDALTIETVRDCARFIRRVANTIPQGNLDDIGGLQGLISSHLTVQKAEGYLEASQIEAKGDELAWEEYPNL